jgi:RimJ/RimL family protein N-acetyltransferase
VSAFRFEPFTEADRPLLLDWLSRPHVSEWWEGPYDADRVQAEFPDPDPKVAQYLAHHGGRPVGFIQSYVVAGAGGGWWEGERDPGARGIDQFLADAADLGKGLGTRMIAAFVARLFADPAVTKIQIDPDPANARAIRCYEKVGFECVGLVETPDGPALLMTLARGRAGRG